MFKDGERELTDALNRCEPYETNTIVDFLLHLYSTNKDEATAAHASLIKVLTPFADSFS